MKTAPVKKPAIFAFNGVLIIWVAIFLFQLVVSGCAWLTRPPSDDPLARQLVEALQQTNGNLKQYKELAQIRFGSQQEVRTVSMALAAVLPDRVRVELLSALGQPMTSLVADGQTISIRPHGKERIYRLRQSSTALEQLIDIPIGVEQFQGMLIGRPKLPEFAFVQIKERNGTSIVVALKSRWLTLARLEFDSTDSTLRMMEVYNEDGDPLYRINWIQWRRIGQYNVPSKLQVETDAGYTLMVSMKRFWPDIAMSAATFELGAPSQSP